MFCSRKIAGTLHEGVRALLASCAIMGIPAWSETSRSGNGAHLWAFFETAVAAPDTHRLGAALISHRREAPTLIAVARLLRYMPLGGPNPPPGEAACSRSRGRAHSVLVNTSERGTWSSSNSRRHIGAAASLCHSPSLP